ncbi:hypothetical protein B4589_014695 [Halolamina sp. CBA1230]|uniref:hypothetical protein n=1 Tax=Halolamina sp. CBA1230 TaxID=1853690 RepID=UPI00159493BE|nr:hypothetical protein [Halolamina sp. CBA1230]QKY21561.1 hypothetical protein B4589_014695 [Halolamina sp. CBA1230]
MPIDDVDDPAAAARQHLLAAHADTIDATLAAADAVAADWPRLDGGRPATADRDALVDDFRAELDERGVLETYPETLAAAVDAAGYALPATPVPAPPYVVLTSTGPALRGTVDDGRLVVRIDCFAVVREPADVDAPVAYAREGESPAAALSVSFVPSK